MGGVLVEDPVLRVVAVRESEARDPVLTSCVTAAARHHPRDECRRPDIHLQPLLVCMPQPSSFYLIQHRQRYQQLVAAAADGPARRAASRPPGCTQRWTVGVTV